MDIYPNMNAGVAAELVNAFVETVPGRSPILKPDPARADRWNALHSAGLATRRGRVTDAGWNAFATMDAHTTARALIRAGITGLFHDMDTAAWETTITRARLAHGPARHALADAARVALSLSLAQRRILVHAFMWSSPDHPITLAPTRSRFNPSHGRIARLAALGVVDPDTAHVTEIGVEAFLRIDPDKFGRDQVTSAWNPGFGAMGPGAWAKTTATAQRFHACRLAIMA